MRDADEATDAEGPSSFVVAAYAQAGVRFLPGQQLVLDNIGTEFGPVRVEICTDYVPEEGLEDPVPRSLWAEIKGEGPDLQSVLPVFAQIPHALGPILALATNAHVGEFQPHLGYDATPGRKQRAFFQSFIADRKGIPDPTRRAPMDALAPLLRAFELSPERERLGRATGQYQMALSYWNPYHHTLALAHLFMGIEALTEVAMRHLLAEEGKTADEVVADRGYEGPHDLKAEVRREVLFQGDQETHRQAKKASDGFEHGFKPFDEVNELAQVSRDKTARYLREAILNFLELEDEAKQILLSARWATPKDWWEHALYIWATLEVDEGVEDLARPDKQYPMVFARRRLSVFKHKPDGGHTIEVKMDNNWLVGEGVRVVEARGEMYAPGNDPDEQ